MRHLPPPCLHSRLRLSCPSHHSFQKPLGPSFNLLLRNSLAADRCVPRCVVWPSSVLHMCSGLQSGVWSGLCPCCTFAVDFSPGCPVTSLRPGARTGATQSYSVTLLSRCAEGCGAVQCTAVVLLAAVRCRAAACYADCRLVRRRAMLAAVWCWQQCDALLLRVVQPCVLTGRLLVCSIMALCAASWHCLSHHDIV